RCVIIYFTKSLFVGDLPTHTTKQKNMGRIVYDLSAITPAHWTRFQRQVTADLSINDRSANIPSDLQIPFARCVLNAKWNAFRKTINDALLHTSHTKRLHRTHLNNSKLMNQLSGLNNTSLDLIVY